MLIRSLNADNFRKYQKLSVENIPQKGVITVAGLNESGKTSIGEAICFALYGRTFFLDEKNLKKVISWGRDVTTVSLTFSAGSVENPDLYTLQRSIDREGASTVNLQKQDSEDVVLDSEEAVSNALIRILGFDFDAFSNSFYLVQRELSTPDPQSDTIKKMAGIGDYGRLHKEFIHDNEEKSQTITELKPEIILNQKNLDAIKLDETWLPELVDAEQTLSAEQSQRESLMSALNTKTDVYANKSAAYSSATKKRSFSTFLAWVLLPLSLVLWLLWGAYKYFPVRLQDTITNQLSDGNMPHFLSFSETWLLPAAVVSLLAFLLNIVFKNKTTATLSNLNKSADEIGKEIQEGHQYITTQAESFLPERVVQLMNSRTSNEQDTLIILPPREQFANLKQLTDDIPDFKAKPEEVGAAISRLSGAIQKQDTEIEALGNDLREDISKEQVRSDEAGAFNATINKLTSLVAKCERNIDVNNISVGLLQRAAVSSIEIFNQNIAEISANTLPKFTEGRYSKVNIAEDLSVKVYSDDKKGYMDFDEISSGTQRQIMLALRMAMSEELAKNTGNTEQFIFLDEPFAFFDKERTKSTLKALPNVSKVISQVWVVAQEFPADVEVDKVIMCPLESAELHA